ncbi:alanine/glycine:cation symporter family protein [Luteibaculum oceani]|uniref:Amino acid carrier protein n=1 Tax=Luteibaculum oceani TaxID=1294296 RepID=A0A5C6V8F0_9FLAO|nr:alanine/glycine:cation symporter family protein [Luteibaculum oceani]TXC81633.1 amino acid carrier protein [Luteibaculum oceani]
MNLKALCGVVVLSILSIFNLSAEPLKVRVEKVNPNGEINNAKAFAIVSGGVAPYQYKWSVQSVPLTSDSCWGITEGSAFTLTVTDAKGNKQSLSDVVSTTSAPEWLNSSFVPIVNAMTTVFFWDPLDALGIRDPQVLQEEERVIPPFWANDNIEEMYLQDWAVADGADVKEGQFLATVKRGSGKIDSVYAQHNGILEILIPKGGVIRNQETQEEEVKVGPTLLGLVKLHEPKPVFHPNGDKKSQGVPIIVIWLVCGALFFTIRMKFINFRGVKHAIELVQGKFDNPNDKGEVSHFQALTTALSATVGLGNIAGVAVAISLGGPGATFWMILAGLMGMASKFVECTLGVKYREINEAGEVSGGPMYYLTKGLEKRNLGKLGKMLAVLFTILCIGASFGGGNMFQANQAFAQVSNQFPSLAGYGTWFGVILSALVFIVIVGGVKSIARVTDKIVPFMCGIYVLFSLIIIFMNFGNIGDVFGEIISGAFEAPAIRGGIVGVLIIGFQRAAFSNEAGVGSASIAHSASKTDEPVSEGIVALLEPFVDTVLVCTMTALVLVFTGYADGTSGLNGSELTSAAFSEVFPWFSWVLMVAILLFAFSTMISWSYYGLKAWTFAFGNSKKVELIYKVIFCGFVIIGSSVGLGAVLDFSDLMILGMAFPNIAGLVIMSGEVKNDLKDYMARVKSGAIKRFK